MTGDIGFAVDAIIEFTLIWFVASLMGMGSSIDVFVAVNCIGLIIVDREGEIGIVGETFVEIDDWKIFKKINLILGVTWKIVLPVVDLHTRIQQ